MSDHDPDAPAPTGGSVRRTAEEIARLSKLAPQTPPKISAALKDLAASTDPAKARLVSQVKPPPNVAEALEQIRVNADKQPMTGLAFRELRESIAKLNAGGAVQASAVLEAIKRTADANNERFAAVASARQPARAIRIPPPGPSRSDRALGEIERHMAGLREITAGQALNVGLQAELAREQGETAKGQSVQLDRLIESMDRASAATELWAKRTHSLERAALILGLFVAIPTAAAIVGWLAANVWPLVAKAFGL